VRQDVALLMGDPRRTPLASLLPSLNFSLVLNLTPRS